jgi:phosphoribosylanthranilate isomerase
MRVKICGVTSERDRDAVVEAGADAVGLIADVDVDTPREVSPERAAALAAGTPPFVSTVLVTMVEDPERAAELVEQVRPDALQVHAADPETVGTVADRVPVRVLAAVDAADERLKAYVDAADALLVDALDERGAGGTGHTADWDRTRAVVDALELPVVLAGGLTPGNVREAVTTVRPFGVDVASGVERAGGGKDHDAVGSFVRRAREATLRGVQ